MLMLLRLPMDRFLLSCSNSGDLIHHAVRAVTAPMTIFKTQFALLSIQLFPILLALGFSTIVVLAFALAFLFALAFAFVSSAFALATTTTSLECITSKRPSSSATTSFAFAVLPFRLTTAVDNAIHLHRLWP